VVTTAAKRYSRTSLILHLMGRKSLRRRPRACMPPIVGRFVSRCRGVWARILRVPMVLWRRVVLEGRISSRRPPLVSMQSCRCRICRWGRRTRSLCLTVVWYELRVAGWRIYDVSILNSRICCRIVFLVGRRDIGALARRLGSGLIAPIVVLRSSLGLSLG
jgi:hypothetical protein